MKKKVKRNLYLGKDTCSLVNFVVLLTKQLVCNLPNFISKSSSFLWFSCSQRVEWMEDRWGEKPWGTPECCSSGSGVHGGCLLCMCCPGVRLHGSDSCLWRKLLPSAAGHHVPAVSLTARGLLGRGRGTAVAADPLCVSPRRSCCPHRTYGGGRWRRSASRTAVWLLKTI